MCIRFNLMIFAKKFPSNISKCFLKLLQKHLVIVLIKICYNKHSDDFLTVSDTVCQNLCSCRIIKLLADYLVFRTDFISIGDTMRCNTLGGGGGLTLIYWDTGCAIF